jgi:hypothetical protein
MPYVPEGATGPIYIYDCVVHCYITLFTFFLYGSYHVFFLRIFLYFTILIPFYNFFVAAVHTLFIHTPLLISTPVSALPVGNYGFVCVEFWNDLCID